MDKPVTKVSERIERLRRNYVNTKPSICCERASIYTESHKRTEGQSTILRRALDPMENARGSA